MDEVHVRPFMGHFSFVEDEWENRRRQKTTNRGNKNSFKLIFNLRLRFLIHGWSTFARARPHRRCLKMMNERIWWRRHFYNLWRQHVITKGWRYSRQTFSFRILQPFVMDFVPHAAVRVHSTGEPWKIMKLLQSRVGNHHPTFGWDSRSSFIFFFISFTVDSVPWFLSFFIQLLVGHRRWMKKEDQGTHPSTEGC